MSILLLILRIPEYYTPCFEILLVFYPHFEIEYVTGPKLSMRTKKIFFFISRPQHMLWVLKRTVSLRRFF